MLGIWKGGNKRTRRCEYKQNTKMVTLFVFLSLLLFFRFFLGSLVVNTLFQ